MLHLHDGNGIRTPYFEFFGAYAVGAPADSVQLLSKIHPCSTENDIRPFHPAECRLPHIDHAKHGHRVTGLSSWRPATGRRDPIKQPARGVPDRAWIVSGLHTSGGHDLVHDLVWYIRC
jgi:hypothetical protein